MMHGHLFFMWSVLSFRLCLGIFHPCDVASYDNFLIPSEGGINVIFVAQKSETIPEKDLQLMRNIVNGLQRNITELYTAEYTKFYTRSLVVFAESVKFVFTLNSVYFTDYVNEHLHVNHSLSEPNGTNIANALREVVDHLHSLTDVRTFAPVLCILLTTAPPDNRTLAIAASNELKDIGVSIIVVAVGDGVEVEDVENFASNKNVVFTAGKHMSDNDSSETVRAITTALRQAYVLPSYEHCHKGYINFFIIIDISKDYIETLSQLRKFAIKFNLDRVSMKAMIINNPTLNDWYLRSFENAELNGPGFKLETFSSFNLQSSIVRGRKQLLNFGPYDKYRFNEKILIIATDKQLVNFEDVISETRACRVSGIHVMALGIGNDVLEDQLSKIISDPRGKTAVKTYEDINFGLEKLNRNICPSVCERTSVYHNGMCYYSSYVLTWDSGRDKCKDTMSTLVSVTDVEKYSWLKTAFSNEFFIGLRKYALDIAQTSREFRWENGKPFVFSDWNKQVYIPEPNGSMSEACVMATLDGWIDVSCSLRQDHFISIICEKEAGNMTKKDLKVKVLPLWEEEICPLPETGLNHTTGPIVASGTSCRPVLDVHVKMDILQFYNCSNGELISKYLVCDGLKHCLDGSDEMNCSTECSEYQFSCNNGRCVSMVFFCDFWDDCGDYSDETGCVIGPCSSVDEWQCSSGQCVPEEARCDLYYDCYDKSDETSCFDICRSYRCGDGTCLPWHWLADGETDCREGFREVVEIRRDRCYTGRYRELFHLLVNPRYADDRPECCMIFDGFGKHLDSYYDSDKNCNDSFACPIGFYKCPSGYCIPIERACDGVMDCVDGEDEVGCGRHCPNFCSEPSNKTFPCRCDCNFICPGYFRCPYATYCHHPARLCDGDADCPGGRDEVMCDFRCPDNCDCHAGVVQCRNLTINDPSLFDLRTRKLVIIQTNITDTADMLMNMYYLREAILKEIGLITLEDILDDLINLRKLQISYNHLTELSDHVFTKQGHLTTLDVSHNPIRKVTSNSFAGLTRLQELHMRYTSLVMLEKGSFSFLVDLKLLDIRWNSIHSISDGSFIGLDHLSTLRLEGNPIERFGQQLYDGLYGLKELHADIYSLCCTQVRPWYLPESKCVSPKSAISSCSDLLANDFLRSSIWILCILSIVGNIFSIVFRLVWEQASMKYGFGVFVTHLGISDFFMGVYLMIVASADMTYRGTYIWHDHDWRHSVFCKIAGTLATISSEASTFFVCLITVDRFLVIKFPFSQTKFRYKSATISAIFCWTVAVVIAVVPLIPSLAYWDFYSKNGACLALPFSVDRKPGWRYSTVIFIGINFIAFIVIALGQYSIYRAIKQGSMITSKERNAKEMAVARRLLLIVATDFLCWFPVGMMSVLALTGRPVSAEAYAWTAVFILPVNSALNPILYTAVAVLKKLRNKESSSIKKTAESIGRRPRVIVGAPDPSLILLEQALLLLDTKEDRFNLTLDVLGRMKDCLQPMASSPSPPNAIYVSMKGKVVDDICLATRSDVSHADPIISLCRTLSRAKPSHGVAGNVTE